MWVILRVYLVLGGAHDLSDNIKRLSKDCGYRNGQERGLEDYADTIVRQITGEAQNAGGASRYAANGIEYARVIERETACEICQGMRGKIIWLGDPRRQPLYHPRCEGGIEPIEGKPANPIMSPDDPRIPQVSRDAILRR